MNLIGNTHFCTDFWKVNSATVPDSFPLPFIEDCIDSIGPAMFITKFDLRKGYWQVQLTARASDISEFVTPAHFLQYTVRALGITNAFPTYDAFNARRRTPLQGMMWLCM